VILIGPVGSFYCFGFGICSIFFGPVPNISSKDVGAFFLLYWGELFEVFAAVGGIVFGSCFVSLGGT